MLRFPAVGLFEALFLAAAALLGRLVLTSSCAMFAWLLLRAVAVDFVLFSLVLSAGVKGLNHPPLARVGSSIVAIEAALLCTHL